MSEPESPHQGAAFRALPATQGHARDRADLRRAVESYEKVSRLHQQITDLIVVVYGDYVVELPHEELEKKINADVHLIKETTEMLSSAGQTLVDLARKLEGYIPSGDPDA